MNSNESDEKQSSAKTSSRDSGTQALEPGHDADGHLQSSVLPPCWTGFVLMPFGTRENSDSPDGGSALQSAVTRSGQDELFRVLVFGLNDAFYQNYLNRTIRTWNPIFLDRADMGAGQSADLLDNVLLKVSNADFCIADLSSNNPNVALEVGYAYARSKHIIKIVQEGAPSPHGGSPSWSDLQGQIYHSVSVGRMAESELWNDASDSQAMEDLLFDQSADFFARSENHPDPYLARAGADACGTFLGRWLVKNEFSSLGDPRLAELEKSYREDVVRRLYPGVRPLCRSLITGRTESEYSCEVFADRETAQLAEALGKARKCIQILTTNLQGLVQHIPTIIRALESSEGGNLRVEILTLDPESEFVNARGALIGREISQFREEMKDSLRKFVDGLLRENDLDESAKQRIMIKTYREFPTQITYIIDDCVYSSVVSVSHQSRHNIIFKLDKDRKGVDASFIQHLDTIWARAIEAR